MNVVLRIGFWLSLFGLVVALVAPTISSGASWAEAEVGVFIGLFFTFVFWATSISTLRAKQGETPFDHAMRKRRAGIVSSLLAFLVMTGVGGVGEIVAQEQWRGSDSTSSSSVGDPYGSSGSSSRSYDSWRSDDGATGSWSCLYAMVAGAVPFIAMFVYLAKKPSRDLGRQVGYPQGYGYPQGGYAVQNGYDQNGYAQNGYAQGGYAQGGYAQNGDAQNGYAQSFDSNQLARQS